MSYHNHENIEFLNCLIKNQQSIQSFLYTMYLHIYILTDFTRTWPPNIYTQ